MPVLFKSSIGMDQTWGSDWFCQSEATICYVILTPPSPPAPSLTFTIRRFYRLLLILISSLGTKYPPAAVDYPR